MQSPQHGTHPKQNPVAVTAIQPSRQRRSRLLTLSISALLAFLASACSGGSDPVLVGDTPTSSPQNNLVVEPSSFTLAEGETVSLSVKLGSTSVGASQTSWTVSSPNVAVVDNYGTVTALKYGEVTITAQYSSLTATSQGLVRARPRAIRANGPTSFTGIVGRSPSDGVAVMAVGQDGAPVPGVEIGFQVLSGTGSLSRSLATTGADGVARVEWTFGTAPGKQEMVARAPELGEVLYAAQVRPDYESAVVEIVSGDGQTSRVATFLPEPLRALVIDQFGNSLPGMAVSWSFSQGGGSMGSPGSPDAAATAIQSATDGMGMTQIYWRLGAAAGQQVAVASVASGVSAVSGGIGGTGPAGAPGNAKGKKFVADADPADPSTVQVAPAEIWTLVGDGARFIAVVRDPYGNPIDGFPTKWSSENPTVVSVDDAGNVQGLSVGRAKITVEIPNLKLVTSGWVNVSEKAPAALSRNSGDGQTGVVGAPLPEPVSVQVVNENGFPMPGVEVSWQVASSPSLMSGSLPSSVSAAGQTDVASSMTNSEGIAQTTWTLGATAGAQSLLAVMDGAEPVGFSAEALPGAPGAITVSPAEVTFSALGETRVLEAWVTDPLGNHISNPSIDFSSLDPSVAEVDQMGVVTARAVGVALIVASVTGCDAKDTVSVNVTQAAYSILTSPNSVALEIGGAFQFQATVLDWNGAEIPNALLQWVSTAPDVATVTQDGLVQAVAAGSSTIQAKTGNLVGTATVTVNETSVSVPVQNPETVTDLGVASVGEAAVSVRWTQVDDGTGNPARYALRYGVAPIAWGSAYSTEVTVDGTAIGASIDFTWTGLAGGTEYDFQLVSYRGELNNGATFGEFSNVVTATPSGDFGVAPQVEAVVASPGTVDLTALGQTAQLAAVAQDASGNPVSGAIIEWSSLDPSIASVDQMGLLTAQKVGTVSIVAAAACCVVADTVFATVAQVPSSVVVSPASYVLNAGEAIQFSGVVVDAEGNTIPGLDVQTWTSQDSSVVIVEPTNGIVHGVQPGSTQVFARYEDLAGQVLVTVVGPSESVSDPLFSDGFESGDLSHTEGGVSWYGSSPVNGSIAVSTDEAKNGSSALRFRFDAVASGRDSNVEKRFGHSSNPQREVWTEYYVFVPRNYKHRDEDTEHHKFYAYWGGEYGAAGRPKVVLELWRVDDNTSTFRFVQNFAGQTSSIMWGDRVTAISASGPMYKGQWHRIRIYQYVGTSDADDAAFRLDVDDTTIFDFSNITTASGSSSWSFDTGYLMGYTNGGYDDQTDWFIDDFKMYTSDPGWW